MSRWGTTTPFHFGKTITTDLVNYNGDYTYASAPKGEYRGQTTDVGNLFPNSFGLYQMHGNVWEWCLDTWHDNYDGSPLDGSPWTANSNNDYIFRMLRGGSWYDLPTLCRSACRNSLKSLNSISDYGFRVVCGVASKILLEPFIL